jgi:hypothetical protein
MLGHVYKLKNHPLEALNKHRKKYGDSGPVPTLWMCDYDQIKEAMRMDVTTGRPQNHLP